MSFANFVGRLGAAGEGYIKGRAAGLDENAKALANIAQLQAIYQTRHTQENQARDEAVNTQLGATLYGPNASNPLAGLTVDPTAGMNNATLGAPYTPPVETTPEPPAAAVAPAEPQYNGANGVPVPVGSARSVRIGHNLINFPAPSESYDYGPGFAEAKRRVDAALAGLRPDPNELPHRIPTESVGLAAENESAYSVRQIKNNPAIRKYLYAHPEMLGVATSNPVDFVNQFDEAVRTQRATARMRRATARMRQDSAETTGGQTPALGVPPQSALQEAAPAETGSGSTPSLEQIIGAPVAAVGAPADDGLTNDNVEAVDVSLEDFNSALAAHVAQTGGNLTPAAQAAVATRAHAVDIYNAFREAAMRNPEKYAPAAEAALANVVQAAAAVNKVYGEVAVQRFFFNDPTMALTLMRNLVDPSIQLSPVVEDGRFRGSWRLVRGSNGVTVTTAELQNGVRSITDEAYRAAQEATRAHRAEQTYELYGKLMLENADATNTANLEMLKARWGMTTEAVKSQLRNIEEYYKARFHTGEVEIKVDQGIVYAVVKGQPGEQARIYQITNEPTQVPTGARGLLGGQVMREQSMPVARQITTPGLQLPQQQ